MSAFGGKADNATERIAAMLEKRVKFSDDGAKLALTGWPNNSQQNNLFRYPIEEPTLEEFPWP
jgi:hypothetical protein